MLKGNINHIFEKKDDLLRNIWRMTRWEQDNLIENWLINVNSTFFKTYYLSSSKRIKVFSWLCFKPL
jgi:hypothetical protein